MSGTRLRRADRPAVRITAPRIARLLLIVVLASCRRHGETDESFAQGEADAPPFHVEHGKAGEAVVVLAPEALAAAGLATALPAPREIDDEIAAFGALVEDPSRVGVLRAPLAGTLTAPEVAGAWPAVGAHVESGAVVGALAPRIAPLTPAERADVEAKLATARADELTTQAELEVAKSALDRSQKLNALDKGVSDQAVEAAAAVVKSGEAKLAAAHGGRAILERLATASSSSLEPLPLSAPRSGEVIAVVAQPGESVEAGQEIARIADFTELFADVRVPIDAAGASPPTKARIVPNGGGMGGASFDATIVGPAPASDPLAPRLRLRVRDPKRTLRPGLGVTAWLAHAAASRPAFSLPASAALRYAGRSWVYVEIEPGHFARRAITIVRADGDALLVSSGVDASAKVVTVGAMILLSQEQLASGGGGEE